MPKQQLKAVLAICTMQPWMGLLVPRLVLDGSGNLKTEVVVHTIYGTPLDVEYVYVVEHDPPLYERALSNERGEGNIPSEFFGINLPTIEVVPPYAKQLYDGNK